MMTSKKKIIPALVLAISAFVAGCGDSSGPASSVDANGALQSLALGLQDGNAGAGSPTTPDFASIFSGIAPLVTQTSITVDGASQQMYAVGFRESFPDGTCEETLFVDPTFPNPGVCTPPSMNTELVFWQSHSATEPPDRMLFVDTDPGTVDFNLSSSLAPEFLGFVIYVQGQNDVWSSLSGSITSTVTGTSQSCSVPLPPYAKTATCSIASFEEQGQIVLEPFTLGQTSTKQMTIAIPRQTLHGLWLAITETQPVTITPLANRSGMLAPRLGRTAPLFRPAR